MRPPESALQGISIRAYAKTMGCSEANVRLAISGGKITTGRIVDDQGNPKIIPYTATKEWAENFGPVRVQNEALAQRLRAFLAECEQAEPAPDTPPLPDEKKATTLAKSQEQEAFYKAELKRLEYEQKTGQLVDRDLVVRNLFAFGAELRSAIMAIPDRVTPLMLTARTQAEAHKLLFDQLADTLDRLTEADTRAFNGS